MRANAAGGEGMAAAAAVGIEWPEDAGQLRQAMHPSPFQWYGSYLVWNVENDFELRSRHYR